MEKPTESRETKTDRFAEHWQKCFEEVKKYLREHGNLSIPKDYKDSTGQLLYTWLFRQKKAWREGRLGADKARMLRDIGADGFDEAAAQPRPRKTERPAAGRWSSN